jgi:hypothetical protein
VPPALRFQCQLDEYIHVPSPSYRIVFASRWISAQGKTAGDAFTYAQRVRMYYLLEAASPPRQRFNNPIIERCATLPFYDECHFDETFGLLARDTRRAEDKVVTEMLVALRNQRGNARAISATRGDSHRVVDGGFRCKVSASLALSTSCSLVRSPPVMPSADASDN